MELILEGGAAVNGRRILQSEVPSILNRVEEILSGLGLVRGEDWEMLGSAGKKKAEETSGDIDIYIKKNRIKEVLGSSDEDIYNDIRSYLEELGYNKFYIQTSINLISFAMPIKDEEDIIQVDFTLVRNLEWTKLVYNSPDYTKDQSKYKANVRNMLLQSIVGACFKRTTKRVTLDDGSVVDGEIEKYIIKLADGLYKTRRNWFGKRNDIIKTVNRMHEYDELISDAPQDVIDLLFDDATIDDFISFESLYDLFMSDKFKFPEKRDEILYGYIIDLDKNKLEIPSEIPQKYVDEAREKVRYEKEISNYNKANKIKKTIKHIETFENLNDMGEVKLINEGGAAVNGRRILQSEVPAIIDKVDGILSGLGLVKGEDWDMVGSAGKKKAEDTSGDIDISIKRDRMKEVLGSGDGRMDVYNDLGKYLAELGYDRQKVSFDQVSFGLPIDGDDDIVQVDFELSRSLVWSKFAKYSPDYRKDESKYKGHVRNILMMCIVKYCFKKTIKRVTLDDDTVVDGEIEAYVIRLADGLYKTRKNWFAKNGVTMNKTENLMHEYDELIADTPQGFIDLIFNDGTIDDFISFETLFDAFMSDRFKFPENRERILVGVVMSLDSQNIEIPTEIPQEYVDKAREKEKFAKEREAFNKENKIKKKIKHIETFESFAVRDNEDILNEGVVVKKARGGMKVVKEDGTESVLPSITKVLSAMDDKDWYEKWVAKIGKEAATAISQKAAHRGTMMHHLLDWYFGGMMEIEELRMELDSKFPSFTDDEKNIAFGLFSVLYNGGVFDSIKDVDSIEKSIYSLENGGFWGKTDFVAVKNNGSKVIVDFKSSKSVHTKDNKVEKYKLQLAGYWLAWSETMGEELTGCELWIAHEDSDVPEVIELHGSELRAKCDEFLGMVAMWHEQFAQPVEIVLGINEMKNIMSFDKFITEN